MDNATQCGNTELLKLEHYTKEEPTLLSVYQFCLPNVRHSLVTVILTATFCQPSKVG